MAIAEHITSRRALLAYSTSVGVAAASRAVAAATGSGMILERVAATGSPAFAAAVRTYEAAKAACEAHSKRHAAAESQYIHERQAHPKFDRLRPDVPADLDDGDRVAFVMRWFIDNRAECDRHEAECAAKIEAVSAHNNAVAERYGIDGIEQEGDRLNDIECDARDEVFAAPAPDWAALVYKLRLLALNDHLASETDDDDPLPLITADAMRLASN